MCDQLSVADVKQLYAARRYAELEAARTEGRLARVLGVGADDIALLDRAKRGRVSPADVSSLSQMRRHDLIEQARIEGRIEHG